MKLQREKEVIQTEFDMIKERWDKTHSIHQKLQVSHASFHTLFKESQLLRDFYYYFQMDRDDAISEIEVLKEKLDKSLYASQKLIDEKETANKEFEKLLEKYDRLIPFKYVNPQL